MSDSDGRTKTTRLRSRTRVALILIVIGGLVGSLQNRSLAAIARTPFQSRPTPTPAGNPSLGLGPSSGPAGTVVSVSGAGWLIDYAGNPVTIAFDGSSVGNAVLAGCRNPNLGAGFGQACTGGIVNAAVPGGAAPGPHTFSACSSNGGCAAATFQVTAPTSAPTASPTATPTGTPPSTQAPASTSTLTPTPTPTATLTPTATPTSTPPSEPILVVDPSSGPAGTVVSVSGFDWVPDFGGALVRIAFDGSAVGNVVLVGCDNSAFGSGFGQSCTVRAVDVAVPRSAVPGPHTFSACGSGSAPPPCATATFQVIAPTLTPTPTSTPTLAPVSNPYDLAGIHDGHLDIGWESDLGHTSNQRIVFSIGGGKLWRLTDVLIDPAATKGDTPASDMKDFQILASSTGTDPSDFSPVLTGTCAQSDNLQLFRLSGNAIARYVELDAIDNYGGGRLAVAEFEIYAKSAPAARSHSLQADIHVARRSAPASNLAQVLSIYHGLRVRPPKSSKVAGKVHMSLYQLYLLETLRNQRASIRFHDKTTLEMNQFTDAVLRSPHLTQVKSGEVDQLVAPGTDHLVATNAATASAIGTNFIVRKGPRISTIIVVEGSVLVSDRYGSVVVKTGQETAVRPGSSPSAPTEVKNLKRLTAWTKVLPNPHLPLNVALDSNGGAIISGPS